MRRENDGPGGKVMGGKATLEQELKLASLREQKRLARMKGGEEEGRYGSAGDYDPVLRSHCRDTGRDYVRQMSREGDSSGW